MVVDPILFEKCPNCWEGHTPLFSFTEIQITLFGYFWLFSNVRRRVYPITDVSTLWKPCIRQYIDRHIMHIAYCYICMYIVIRQFVLFCLFSPFTCELHYMYMFSLFIEIGSVRKLYLTAMCEYCNTSGGRNTVKKSI